MQVNGASSPSAYTAISTTTSPSTSSSAATKSFPSSSSDSSRMDSLYWRHWLCFYVLGIINNFHFVVVLSSAYSLASSFDALSYIGVVQWATVILGIAAKAVNAVYLLQSSYSRRIHLGSLTAVVGLVMLVLSPYVSFSFAIVAICLLGAYSALGESVLLGYLKHFHPKMTGGWSSGTGISGVAGTAGYLLMFSVLGFSNQLIYALITPTMVLYALAFTYINDTAQLDIAPAAAAISPAASASSSSGEDTAALLPASSSAALASASLSSGAGGEAARWSSVWRVCRQVQSEAFHLSVVYYLEYSIIVGFASQSNPSALGSGWLYENAYEILNFCYQIGVLISRSSITVIQIRRIWVISALQAANFVLWFLQAWVGVMPLWLQFIAMVWVGIMGGAMYVNVFYLLMKETKVADADRELAINCVSTVYYVGIIASSLTSLLFLNTILTRQQ